MRRAIARNRSHLLNAAGEALRAIHARPGWITLGTLHRALPGFDRRELRWVLRRMVQHGVVERGEDLTGRVSYRAVPEALRLAS